jgi:transposase
MFHIPNAFLVQFRCDVVAVARQNEAPLSQIAKEFEISGACLHNSLKRADVEDGLAPRATQKDAME